MAAITAVWSFRPQEVLMDTIDANNTWTVFPGQRSSYSGRPTTSEQFVRIFRLRYTAVNTVNMDNMIQFYNLRRGPYEAFFWYHAVTQTSYTVRFGEAIAAQTGPYVGALSTEIIFVVTSG